MVTASLASVFAGDHERFSVAKDLSSPSGANFVNRANNPARRRIKKTTAVRSFIVLAHQGFFWQNGSGERAEPPSGG
jgi:hypothetical protein